MIWALIRSEVLQFVRNRVATLMTLAAPVAFVLILVLTRRGTQSTVVLTATTLTPVAGLGTYVTATSTIAARRQLLVLKRLRLTALRPSAILCGLLAPIVVINTVQLVIILTAAVAIGDEAPSSLLPLLVAVIGVQGMFVASALVTALWTSSAEQAQYTTLPVLVSAVAASFWALTTPSQPWQEWLQLLLPGGAVTRYAVSAWFPAAYTDALVQVAVITAWAVLPALAAVRWFTWDPRARARRTPPERLGEIRQGERYFRFMSSTPTKAPR